MIMTKKEDRTYKQVGFIYRNDEIDVSGEVPVDFKTIDGIIGDYTIKGNAYQLEGVSPDTPQEVKAVGDRTGNLFDKSTITADNFAVISGTIANKGYYCSDFIPITATTYYFQNAVGKSYQHTVVVYDANKQGLRYENLPGSKKASGAITFQSGDAYIRINCYYQTDVDTVMVNIGSTALSYEPYGYKIPVVTRGKNLLEPIGFSAQSITNINDHRIKTNSYGTSLSTVYGGSVLVTQANHSGTTTSYTNGFFFIAVDFSKFTTGKNYILSFDYEIKEKHSASGSIAYIGNSTNFANISGDWGKDGRKSVKFTVKKGFNPYIEIRLCGNSIFVSNLQIEEDLTATPYEPYHEPITTPIYLDSPLYKIGDYADSLNKTEEVRVIKELILTGNENWIEVGGNANNTTALFTCAINDIIDCGNVVAMDVLTTHYKVGAYYSASVTSEGLQHTRKNIYIRSKQLNVADFKAYLATQYAAGTPVTIYYVLAEPETKSITLPKIPTLDGTNIIDINTEIKPSNISLFRPMTEIKKILNKEGKILFEKGFTREVKSILPLTLNGINKPLKNYTIYGNTLQNGTPTPDNPVEVQAAGDRTGNLFDTSILADNYTLNASTGLPYSFPKRIATLTPIDVTSLSSVTLSYQSEVSDTMFIYAIFNGSTLVTRVAANHSGDTIDVSGGNILYISLYSQPDNITIDKVSNIMLNEGLTPLPYEPYGYKIPVVTRGKNLAGNYTVSSGYYYDSSGTPTVADKRFIRCSPINVKTGTNYVISSNLRFYSIWKFKYDQAIERILVDNKNVFVFNTGTDCNRIRISMINTSGEADTSAFEWIQLEEGTTATPYEPYHEPITTPIYLPTPLYSGEVMRSDGSREVKWGKLVLTGKEASISIYAGTGPNGVAMIIANMQKGFYQDGFCSHAIVAKNHADGTIGLGVNNNTLYWFGILDILGLSASSVAPFKEWLKEQYAAGTPVTVWYRLAKPKTETFTAPQIPTINGTTVIDVDTAVKPTEMYTKYKSSK